MNISALSEIKNEDVFIYYDLPNQEEARLWVGDRDKADEIAELIYSTHHGEEGFYIFRGEFTNQEKTGHYLALVEDDKGIRMYDGTWDEIIQYYEEPENEGVFMRTSIPLFKYKPTQEEVVNMSFKVTDVLTGADIITTAKSGDKFRTIAEPVVVIKRNEEGIIIYNDTKEGVVIDNKFLMERFVPYAGAKAAPARKYLSIEEAMKALADDKHVHVDLNLPNGEVHEDVCLNQFLPIAQAIESVKEEEGILGLMQFTAAFQRSAQEGDEDALDLINPINARIPVEVLVYGKFFIEDHEELNSFI